MRGVSPIMVEIECNFDYMCIVFPEVEEYTIWDGLLLLGPGCK